ncbi:MAG: hypothetical protein E7474_12975 [Ruminococcaceae bacterium]|nr:hypothetical protein [Oscillospiraceae bacterium]
MGKTILGVDIGFDSLKIALCKDGKVKKAATEPMPVNLMKENRITSVDAMGELIKSTMKKNKISASAAAMVLPNEVSYVRNVTMPPMAADQLAYNIPFEFNDYIVDELKNYIFDYAMISNPKENPDAPMEMMAVAMPSAIIDESRTYFSRAGLKLVKAAPVEYAYISLIRQYQKENMTEREYCILDLGYRAIRMFMYNSDRHVVTRLLDIGIRNLVDSVAEAMNVETHLAKTYLESNYENCQEQEACVSAYNNIATELMRAMNFYRFSNRDSQLNDVWLCGGGAEIPGLCDAIANTLEMKVHPISELMPGGSSPEIANLGDYAMAVAVTLD